MIFFAIPLATRRTCRCRPATPRTGTRSPGHFATYSDALSEYSGHFARSLGYAAAATLLDLLIAFPLAYFIAFKAGRYKNFLLVLVILPFFVSYVLRTVSWQLILADNGWVVERLRDVGLLGDDGRLLATRTAVIAGIAYNFLPFMALPLYVTLEKIDRRLVEAATDLYANRAHRVPQGDAAAGAAGDLRRLAADVHPRDR